MILRIIVHNAPNSESRLPASAVLRKCSSCYESVKYQTYRRNFEMYLFKRLFKSYISYIYIYIYTFKHVIACDSIIRAGFYFDKF